MASPIDVITQLVNTAGDLYLGMNNASVALGGFELKLQNVVEVGGRVNQSLVALNRVTSLYGKTANELSAQTAALAKQFYVPYEKLLSIQQKLAASLPISITRQRELASVLQFAADRFGNTEQGIEAYVNALESLSNKSHLAYQDQLLLISAAERLRKAQKEGGDAASAATAAYARQSAITRDNAEIMYVTGEISRDELATIIRSTEALDAQNKARLQTTESASRAANEFRSMQVSMFEALSMSDAFNEFYKGLQVAPGALAAGLTAKMTAKGMEFFDVEHIDTQADEVQEVFKAFAENAQAAMKKAADEGKTYEQTISEITQEMEKEGPIAARAFEAYLKQDGAVKSLKANWEGANKAALERATMEALIARYTKEGNVEKIREINQEVAKANMSKARMEMLDAQNLLLKRSVDHAKTYNELEQSTVALAEMQFDVLSRIRDLGGSIGDSSAIQAANMQEILAAAQQEYRALAASAAIRQMIAEGSKAIYEASGEEKRKAALEQVLKIEQSVADARAAAARAAGSPEEGKTQESLERLEIQLKTTKELYEASKYDEQAAFNAKQAVEAKKADLAAQQSLKKGYDDMYRVSTMMGESAEKFASRRVDLARSELDLLDSVASGIGASAAARAEAAAEQGRVVRAVEEQIAGTEQVIANASKELAVQEALLAAAEAAGDQQKANDARKEAAAATAAVQTGEQKILELTAKRNTALKSQLDLTKQIREGYLDALSAMSEGAGVFQEIIVDQTKNLGTLLRTAKDMPTSLRTGANTGPGAGISQFTAGGLESGEWNKDMADYTNEIVSDQIPQIIKHLSNIANRPTGDMASLNPNRLGVVAEGGGEGTSASGGAAKQASSAAPATPAPASPATLPAGSPSPASVSPAPAIEQGLAKVSMTWGADLGKAVAAAEEQRADLVSALGRFSESKNDQISTLIADLNKTLGEQKAGGDQSRIYAILQTQISALTKQLADSEAAAKQAAEDSRRASEKTATAAEKAISKTSVAETKTTQAAKEPSAAPGPAAQPFTVEMLTAAVQDAHQRVLGTVGKDASAIREVISRIVPQLEQLHKAVGELGQQEIKISLPSAPSVQQIESDSLRSVASDTSALREYLALAESRLSDIQSVIASSAASAASQGQSASLVFAESDLSTLASAIAKAADGGESDSLSSMASDMAAVRDQLLGASGQLRDIQAAIIASSKSESASMPGEPRAFSSADAATLASSIVKSIDDQAEMLSQMNQYLGKMASEPSVRAPVVGEAKEQPSATAELMEGQFVPMNSRLEDIRSILAALSPVVAAGLAAGRQEFKVNVPPVQIDAEAISPLRSLLDSGNKELSSIMRSQYSALDGLTSASKADFDNLLKGEQALASAKAVAASISNDASRSEAQARIAAMESQFKLTRELLETNKSALRNLVESKPASVERRQEGAYPEEAYEINLDGVMASVSDSGRMISSQQALGLSEIASILVQNRMALDEAMQSSSPDLGPLFGQNIDIGRRQELLLTALIERMGAFASSSAAADADSRSISQDVGTDIRSGSQLVHVGLAGVTGILNQIAAQAFAFYPTVQDGLSRISASENITVVEQPKPLELSPVRNDLGEGLKMPNEAFSYLSQIVNLLSEAPKSPGADISPVISAIRDIELNPSVGFADVSGALKEMAARLDRSNEQVIDVQVAQADVDIRPVVDALQSMPQVPVDLLTSLESVIYNLSSNMQELMRPSASSSTAERSIIDIDISPVAAAVQSLPQVPAELLDKIGRVLDVISRGSAPSPQPSVLVDVQSPEIAPPEIDLAGIASALPIELLQKISSNIGFIASQASVRETLPVDVDVEIPQLPETELDISPLVDTVKGIPSLPLDLLERMGKALDLLTTTSAPSVPVPVVVNVNPQEAPPVDIDLSTIADAINAIPSIPVDLLKGMSDAVQALSAISGKSEPVNVNVAAPAGPDVIVDMVGVIKAINSIPSVPLDMFESVDRTLAMLAEQVGSIASPEVMVSVEAAEQKPISINADAVVDAVRSIPVVPADLIEMIGKSMQAMVEASSRPAVPPVTVDVAPSPVPDIKMDMSSVADAVMSLPEIPLNLLEGIGKSIDLLSSRDQAQVAPGVSVAVAPAETPDVYVDVANVVQAIQNIPTFPADLIQRMDMHIEALTSSIATRPEQPVNIDVSVPETTSAPVDFAPVVDAIKSIPQTPLAMIDALSNSIAMMANGLTRASELDISVDFPEVKSPDVNIDLSSVVDAVSSLPSLPEGLLDRVGIAVDKLVSEMASTASREISVGIRGDDLAKMETDSSPIVEAIGMASSLSATGLQAIVAALRESAVISAVTPQNNVVVDVEAPAYPPVVVDASAFVSAIADIPQLPIETFDAMRRSIENLVTLASAEASGLALLKAANTASTSATATDREAVATPVVVDFDAVFDQLSAIGDVSAAAIERQTSVYMSELDGLVSSLTGLFSKNEYEGAREVVVSVDTTETAGKVGIETFAQQLGTRLMEIGSSSEQSAEHLYTLISYLSAINSTVQQISSSQNQAPEAVIENVLPTDIASSNADAVRAAMQSAIPALTDTASFDYGHVLDVLARLDDASRSSFNSISAAVLQLQESTPSSRVPVAAPGQAATVASSGLSGAMRSIQADILDSMAMLRDAVSISPTSMASEVADSIESAVAPGVAEIVGGFADSASSLKNVLQSGVETVSGSISDALASSVYGFKSAVDSFASKVETGSEVKSSPIIGPTASNSMDMIASIGKAISFGISDSLVGIGDQIRVMGEELSLSNRNQEFGSKVVVDVQAPEVEPLEFPSLDVSPIASALAEYARDARDSASLVVGVLREEMERMVAGMGAQPPAPLVTVSPIVNVDIPKPTVEGTAPGESPTRVVYPELLTVAEGGFFDILGSFDQLRSINAATNSLLASISSANVEPMMVTNVEPPSMSVEAPSVNIDSSAIVGSIGNLAAITAGGIEGARNQMSSLMSAISDFPKANAPAVEASSESAMDVGGLTPVLNSISSSIADIHSAGVSQGAMVLAALSSIDNNSRTVALRSSNSAGDTKMAETVQFSIEEQSAVPLDLSPVIVSDEKLSEGLIGAIRAESRVMVDGLNSIQSAIIDSYRVQPKEAEPIVNQMSSISKPNSYGITADELVNVVVNPLGTILASLFAESNATASAPATTPATAPVSAVNPPSTPVEASGELSVEVKPSARGEEIAAQQARAMTSIFDIIGAQAKAATDLFSRIDDVMDLSAEPATRVVPPASASGKERESIAAVVSAAVASAVSTAAIRGFDAFASRTEVNQPSRTERVAVKVVESSYVPSGDDADAFRASMLDMASRYEAQASKLKEQAVGAIDLDRLADVISARNAQPTSIASASPSMRVSDVSAGASSRSVENISITMPDNFVRNLSTQVAEMTKSQVVPAIVDGFAQAIRQGFSA